MSNSASLPLPAEVERVDTRPRLRGIPDVFAVVAAIPALALLLGHTREGLPTLGVVVYGFGLLLVFGTSALYHTRFWSPRVFLILQRLDHAAIFFLIAGTYTPFCLVAEPSLGLPLLAVVWGCALPGAARYLFWPLGNRRGLRAVLYVILGVAAIPRAPALYEAFGPQIFFLVAAGGALYILGAGIYIAKWPNPFPRTFGYHEVFHQFVIAAAVCHYLAVWRAVTGP